MNKAVYNPRPSFYTGRWPKLCSDNRLIEIDQVDSHTPIGDFDDKDAIIKLVKKT